MLSISTYKQREMSLTSLWTNKAVHTIGCGAGKIVEDGRRATFTRRAFPWHWAC